MSVDLSKFHYKKVDPPPGKESVSVEDAVVREVDVMRFIFCAVDKKKQIRPDYSYLYQTVGMSNTHVAT